MGPPDRAGPEADVRSVEAAIEIRASPEEVFDLIHDYARRLAWDPFLKEARLLEGAKAAGPGIKALCTARSGSAGLVMETVHLSLDRPRVIASALFRREVRQRLEALKRYLERPR